MHISNISWAQIVRTAMAFAALTCAASALGHQLDASLRDAAYPPTVVEFAIPSGGASMNGHAYIAMGAGPHATVVLVHGYPGNEKNLDLAQALRRAGINTVFFHPRGAWGSTGTWSVANSLEDIQAVINFVRSDDGAQQLRSDSSRIGLLGHSLGGFLTLMSVSQIESVRCAASMAGTNLGLSAQLVAADKSAAERIRKRLSQRPGPLVWADGYTLYDEVIGHGETWNLLHRAEALAGKPLLLVAGSKDNVVPPTQNHAPLVNAITKIHDHQLQTLELEAAHSFSSKRLALARALTDFFTKSCSF